MAKKYGKELDSLDNKIIDGKVAGKDVSCILERANEQTENMVYSSAFHMVNNLLPMLLQKMLLKKDNAVA